MLAALNCQIQLMRIAHSLQRFEHRHSSLTAAAGADFIAHHLTGAAAQHKNLSFFWFSYLNELLCCYSKLLNNLFLCFHNACYFFL